MSNPSSQNKNTVRKKLNSFATLAGMSYVKRFPTALADFADAASNPRYVTHTRLADREALKNRLFGTNEQEITNQEEEKKKAVNAIVEETQLRQIRYILNEVGHRAGRKQEEIDALIEQNFANYLTDPDKRKKYAGENLLSAVNTLRVVKDKNGNDVPLYVKKKDATGNERITRESDQTLLSNEEIDQIVTFSALEETIGTPESYLKEEQKAKLADYRDVVDYNRTPKAATEPEQYREQMVDKLLEGANYDRGTLQAAFSDCFESPEGSEPAEVDYDELAKARREFVVNRMKALPEAERNEAAFIRESERVDALLKTYVFPRNDAKPDYERVFGTEETKEAYTAFALSTIPPKALAKETETQFMNYINNTGDRELTFVNKAATYIKYLQDAHAKRPFWTRFVDWFRRDGENSTIERMKKTLMEDYDKDMIEDGMRQAGNTNLRIGERYDALSNGEASLPASLDGFDQEFDRNREFVKQLPSDMKEKETEKNPALETMTEKVKVNEEVKEPNQLNKA